MRKMKISIYVLPLVVALASCKKFNFGDVNINPDPNVKIVPSTAELFTNVSRQLAGNLTIADATPALYVQYFSETQYPGASLYTFNRSEWSDYYSGPLKDAASIIQLNSDAETAATAAKNGSNKNQVAIARIMKAYLFSVVTDKWGDVPYFDALSGVAKPTPRYDKQSDIYADLFKELTEAVAQFDAGETVQGELLFNGDPVKWKRFANSLRMILAMRISNADPVKAKTEFLAAYNDAGGWINDNSKNAAFPFLNNRNFRNPYNEKVDQRDDLGMSEVFIDSLNSLNDRRVSVYATPTNTGTYRGTPYGWNQADIISWTTNNSYSRIGTAITNMDAPGYIITAAQMQLVKAEAALRGWLPASDIAAYYTAIQLSWEQWGVFSQTAFNNYVANSRVNLGNSLTDVEGIKRKLGLQKWLTLYPNGQEEWSEWRRLNYPVLKPARDAGGGKQIPKRMGYPGTETTLNGANYQLQVSGMPGGDSPETPVWWDK